MVWNAEGTKHLVARLTYNMQVRQKVYKGSLEQWKKYEPFLNGVFDGLPLS